MTTTKFEHIIGKDGLHRIRKTSTDNGEIIGNTHEGMSRVIDMRTNEALNLRADLELIGIPESLISAMVCDLVAKLWDIPAIDEREMVKNHTPNTEDCKPFTVVSIGGPTIENTPLGGRKCPNDTDGDGNCGRPACPICGVQVADPFESQTHTPEN